MRTAAVVCAVFLVATAAEALPVGGDFARYKVILERKPFGEPPPEPKQAPPPAPVQPQEPPFTRFIKLCAITESGSGLRVGFIDMQSKPQKSYYMRVGEYRDGFKVLQADYEDEGALLEKDGQQGWVYINRNEPGGGGPAETPPLAVTGQTQPNPFLAAANRANANAGAKPDSQSAAHLPYAQRLKIRRAVIQQREEGEPKLEGQALEQHLKNYQMDLIREGQPPLPIPLTPEMDDQLVSEGVLPPATGDPQQVAVPAFPTP